MYAGVPVLPDIKKAQLLMSNAFFVFGADGDAHGGANVVGGTTPGETRLDNFVGNKIGRTASAPSSKKRVKTMDGLNQLARVTVLPDIKKALP